MNRRSVCNVSDIWDCWNLLWNRVQKFFSRERKVDEVHSRKYFPSSLSFTGKECCASGTFLYFTVHSRTFMLQLFLQTGQARENGKTTSKSVWLTVTPQYAPPMRCFLPQPQWEISQRWYLTETCPSPSPSPSFPFTSTCDVMTRSLYYNLF